MTDRPAQESWRRALDGDRDAFEAALAPYTATLREAAGRQLAVERDVVSGEPAAGEQVVDLTPDELVGETLLRAWDRRERYDGTRMSFRAWLLGLQTRSLARFARREERYADRKAISLDEELPTNEDQDAVGEQFYEFRQPFDVDTYEEIIAGSEPADLVLRHGTFDDLSDDDRERLSDATLQAEARQAVVLHDEFAVSLPEVAQILDASLKDTAASLGLAREGVLARLGSTDDDHDDDPAVDSYTGDPLPDA
jgi:DNA-directed RNA polymerase specialized sigma24 family protein